MMTIEGYDGERVLLSYDVSGAARTVAARVCQIIFGRVRISEGPVKVRYQEKGFIHRPGVVWVGQGVFVILRAMQANYPIACASSAFVWQPVRCPSRGRPWRRSAAA